MLCCTAREKDLQQLSVFVDNVLSLLLTRNVGLCLCHMIISWSYYSVVANSELTKYSPMRNQMTADLSLTWASVAAIADFSVFVARVTYSFTLLTYSFALVMFLIAFHPNKLTDYRPH